MGLPIQARVRYKKICQDSTSTPIGKGVKFKPVVDKLDSDLS